MLFVFFKKESKKDIQHIFIDLHQQQPPLLLSATVLSYGGLHHMAVGRPADQARKEERKVLRFRNIVIAPPGVHSSNHSENGPVRGKESPYHSLRIKLGK